MNKLKLRNTISFFGYLEAVGMTVFLFYLVFRAYIGGFDHIIYINMYGEAHVEWFVMCIVLCLVLIGFFFYLKDHLKIVSEETG